MCISLLWIFKHSRKKIDVKWQLCASFYIKILFRFASDLISCKFISLSLWGNLSTELSTRRTVNLQLFQSAKWSGIITELHEERKQKKSSMMRKIVQQLMRFCKTNFKTQMFWFFWSSSPSDNFRQIKNEKKSLVTSFFMLSLSL